MKYMLKTRAAGPELNLKIKLQGDFINIANPPIKAVVSLYTAEAKIKEFADQSLIQENQNVFSIRLPLSDIDLTKIYAVFIKPEKYLGRLFCSQTVVGVDCHSPQLIFSNNQNDIDLSQYIFLSGDLKPFDGKVSAYDLSIIIRDLGKIASPSADTDINFDGYTDTQDYSLALYSLGQNAVDDPINFVLLSVTPTPIAPVTPTQSAVTNTPTPTAITPTSTTVPTHVPTATTAPMSSPTPIPLTPTPTIKIPNYSKIIDMVTNPPQIACKNGTTTGCPLDALYNTPLDKGLGFATYYGDERATGYNVVADVIHNNKGITVEAARKFINDNLMTKQSDISPDQARKTNKVVGFGATRSPADLWKIKYAFGIDNPHDPHPYFIGRVLIIDCPRPTDWTNYIATWSYGYKNWNNISWIVDLSKNGFIQLPTGLSGLKENTGEGRPGIVLIDESILDQMIYQ